MANHKSAEKRMRQIKRRNEINRRSRSSLRTAIKKLRAAVASGDRERAVELLRQAISTIDKSIQKGVLHRNAAARYKSRLTTRVNGLQNRER